MKSTILSSRLVRLAVLSGLLAFAPALVRAADKALAQLQGTGAVAVKAAGPYVEVGTFLIQVSTKLGQPGQKLADGSWLYPNYAVTDSGAKGTLRVQFVSGRVNTLTLLSPSALVALQSSQPKASDHVLLARQDRR